MPNDYNRLKEEADIEQVVNYLGIPVKQRGAVKFILCPNPAHDDQHATNCYFKPGWNNVYCKACNKSTGAIDLIMDTLGCEMGEAADMLWELEGQPDWYYDTTWKSPKKRFFLSTEERKLLGLHFPRRISVPTRCTPFKEYTSSEMPAGANYSVEYPDKNNENWILMESEQCDWKDFASEEVLKEMVRTRAKQRMKYLERKNAQKSKKYRILKEAYKKASA